jgi:hypothetical protein
VPSPWNFGRLRYSRGSVTGRSAWKGRKFVAAQVTVSSLISHSIFLVATLRRLGERFPKVDGKYFYGGGGRDLDGRSEGGAKERWGRQGGISGHFGGHFIGKNVGRLSHHAAQPEQAVRADSGQDKQAGRPSLPANREEGGSARELLVVGLDPARTRRGRLKSVRGRLSLPEKRRPVSGPLKWGLIFVSASPAPCYGGGGHAGFTRYECSRPP